jgi:hypothetical protein
LFHLKLDALTLAQAIKVELAQGAAMEEDFPSILGIDEPESAVAVDSLNRSLHMASAARRGRPAARNPFS